MISYPSRASMHLTSSTISSLSSTIRIVFFPFIGLPLIDPNVEAGLFRQGVPDGLVDPPFREGGEAAVGGVETLRGPDEAQVAFGDQIAEGQAPVAVVQAGHDHDFQMG